MEFDDRLPWLPVLLAAVYVFVQLLRRRAGARAGRRAPPPAAAWDEKAALKAAEYKRQAEAAGPAAPAKPAGKPAKPAAPLPIDFTTVPLSESSSDGASDGSEGSEGSEGSATTALARGAARRPRRVVRAARAAGGPGAVTLRRPGALPSLASPVVVFYSTLTGTSERLAKQLHAALAAETATAPELHNLDYVDDLDAYFVSPPARLRGAIYLLVVPSYETESPLDYFVELLRETYHDFRIDSRPLHRLAGFSVFGVGDADGWPDTAPGGGPPGSGRFCYQARQVDRLLGKLGARRVFPLGTGCVRAGADAALAEYTGHLLAELRSPSAPEELDIVDSDDEAEPEDTAEMMDVEDLGKAARKGQADKPAAAAAAAGEPGPKAMVARDSPTYKALTKQGYTIVGSHSGVKICRWTKSALRGRGSCYKYAFYGIRSHLCMETTPSLSCSNKCVFCWRHGTNPVGTTWRWQVDQPEEIFEGALAGHYQKIKQMRGVPGVLAARFAEAFQVRHCALSLVGEPIFYPHIDRFLALLHGQRISSFLVCNAQHPAELEALGRVTQLYVSIDASDKDTLRRVDRPLHRDFWERMMACLDIIKRKEDTRTVYRLTLVKGFNADMVEGYADLVERGRPCFIEVKGVTFCGNSATQQLTMDNVPFYQEVLDFVELLGAELKRRGLDYGLATAHAHSCCTLLAQARFNINGRWHTHIDYARFFELLESGVPFGPMDYVAETPAWAVYGAPEGGFDPNDVPHRRGKPVTLGETGLPIAA